MPKLRNYQPNQPPKQSHAEDHAEQTDATSGEDHRWRTGRLQSRKEHHRADLQPNNPLWQISPAPTRPLPCLHRVWHAALWATMKKYNTSANLIRVIKNFYDKATSAVLFNRHTGDWFQATVGDQQGCLLSPTLSNIFLERIMTDALEDHEGNVNNGSRTITNLHFADDIKGLAAEEELAKLVEHLDKASTAYSMDISAEKTKLMTNNTSGINREIKVNRQQLEMVTSFQYLGSVTIDEGSNPQILSRIAQTIAALTRLKPVWNDRSICLSSKICLMCSFVTSIFLYACETWTLTAELQKKNTSYGNEMLLQDTTHLIQRPCYQWRSPCQDPAGNRTTQRPPVHRKETQTAVVHSCLPFIRSGQNHFARHSERGMKTR